MSIRHEIVYYIETSQQASAHTNLSLSAALCVPAATVRRATRVAVERGELLRVSRPGWLEFEAVPRPASASF